MHKLIALRFTLPAIVIVAVVTLAFIAFAVVSSHIGGSAWGSTSP